jgi:hypothetical protein
MKTLRSVRMKSNPANSQQTTLSVLITISSDIDRLTDTVGWR